MRSKTKRIFILLCLLGLMMVLTGCEGKSRVGLWRNSEAIQYTTGGSSGRYWCIEITDSDTISYSFRFIDGTLADSTPISGTLRDEGGGVFSTPSSYGRRNYYTYHRDTDTITVSDMTLVRIK